MIADQRWQVGDKVTFNAVSFQWQDWLGTLRTCELPQVAAYDCVVRIHFIERNGRGDVLAYGVVISLQTRSSSQKAIEMAKQDLLPLEDGLPPKAKFRFKEDAKERLIAERDEKRKKDKPNYQEMIRSNIKGYNE
jgi:hypothetical protein